VLDVLAMDRRESAGGADPLAHGVLASGSSHVPLPQRLQFAYKYRALRAAFGCLPQGAKEEGGSAASTKVSASMAVWLPAAS
jgi:hypothetical protein